jgi:hypothetical protein
MRIDLEDEDGDKLVGLPVSHIKNNKREKRLDLWVNDEVIRITKDQAEQLKQLIEDTFND